AAQRRRGKILLELQKADESAGLVLHALHQDRRQRRQKEDDQTGASDEQQSLRQPVVPVHGRSHPGCCCPWKRNGGAIHRHQPSTRSAAGGRLTVTDWPGASCAASTVWRGTLA